MKKGKFLALALVVAIMMMGAGYAYWTENLTVKSTVDTGKLSYQIVNPGVEVDKFMYSSIDKCEDGELEVTFGDMYPNAGAKVNFTLYNDGTMDAKINNFYFEGPAFSAKDGIDYSTIILKSVTIGKEEIPVEKSLQDIDGILPLALEKAFPLPKNETVECFAEFWIDKDANESNFPEDKTYTFSLKADILQYNDNETTVVE